MLNRRGNNSGLTHPPALSKEKKGKKMMKKVFRKLKDSEAYREYCINMARLYNWRASY